MITMECDYCGHVEHYEDESGAINYTKAGQDMFNNYVEIIEGYLHNVGIVHEDQKENV